MKRKTLAIIFGVVVATAAMVAAANLAAGAFLFLIHKQDPSGATWQTMYQAWDAADDKLTQKKIILSALFGAGLGIVGPVFGLIALLRRPDKGLFGRARFANKADIKAEGLDVPKGVLLGRIGNEFLRLGGYEFVMLAAPTRTGKGVGFVIPNLLTYDGSVFVLDIKGENFNLTSEFRRRFLANEIVYFNPFSETTHRWNPLAYIPEDPKFWVNNLNALATDIYPPNPKDPFWNDSAKNLFIALALVVLETPALPKTIGEVLRQASGKGQQISDYLRHIIEVRSATDKPLSTTCLDYLNRFLSNSDTVLKGIVSSFVAPLAIWGNPVIDKATSGNDFDLRDVRKKKMSVYVHVNAGDVQQAGFILNLLFSQLINENVKELPENNPELKHQCLLMLDECTAMGKVGILAKGVGFMAGYNMRLVIVIQDKDQLEATYGKADAHNIVSNMGAVLYFTPSQFDEAERYSKMIGNETVTNTSKQRSNIGAFSVGERASETEAAHSRALMLPQELMSMPKTHELIVRAGIPVIKANKISYYQDPFFVERFTAVPMRDAMVDGKLRRVPIPVALPKANWRMFNTTVMASNYYLGEDFADLVNDATQTATDQMLVGLINEPDSYPRHVVDSACKELARRKVDDLLFELETDNSALVARGPFKELVLA